MQSQTDYNCLIFLHCVFSNDSSNGLPERMHNHIGCIYLTFLHYVFSNVSPNRPPQRMQSHTGCMCWSFLHCAFLNASLNGLPWRRYIHTGCICKPSYHHSGHICHYQNPSLTFIWCLFFYCFRPTDSKKRKFVIRKKVRHNNLLRCWLSLSLSSIFDW